MKEKKKVLNLFSTHSARIFSPCDPCHHEDPHPVATCHPTISCYVFWLPPKNPRSGPHPLSRLLKPLQRSSRTKINGTLSSRISAPRPSMPHLQPHRSRRDNCLHETSHQGPRPIPFIRELFSQYPRHSHNMERFLQRHQPRSIPNSPLFSSLFFYLLYWSCLPASSHS